MRIAKAHVALLWFAVVAFGVPMLLYAYKGTLIRSNIDDYCYGAILKQYGFLRAQAVSYEQVTFYNGNRYSLTFLMGIATSLPPQSLGLFPVLSMAAWGVSIFFAIFQMKELFRLKIKLAELLVLSEALLFFTLYRAPNLTQVLFWVSGLAPYLAPLVFNTLLFGILLYCARKSELHWGWYPLVFLLALVGGGFSETTTVMEFLWLGLFFLCSLRFRRTDRRFHLLVITAILGSGLSLLLLAFSPSNQKRLLGTWHYSLPAVGLWSLRYGVDFVIDSMKRSYLPAVVCFATAFVISATNGSRLERKMRARVAAALVLFICLLAFLLIAFSMAPSVYAQDSYPGDRALLPAEYVEVAALMLMGWLLAQSISVQLAGPWSALLLLALFILALYPLRASTSIRSTIRRYQIWQTLWDIRYRQIQEAEKNGIMDIEVFKIDLNPAYDLDDISDLGNKPNSHYNQCAAQYFGLNSITADLYPP